MAMERKLVSCPFCGKALFEENKSCDTIQTTLQEIIRIAGIDVLSDTKRMIAYFSDIAPHLSKEQGLLETFLNCGGGTVFLANKNSSPEQQKIQYYQLVNKLQKEKYIAENPAVQICESVAYVVFGKHMNQQPAYSIEVKSDIQEKQTVPETINSTQKTTLATNNNQTISANKTQSASASAPKSISSVSSTDNKSVITIPGDTKTIKANAYSNRRNITEVYISEGVRTIESGAFV